MRSIKKLCFNIIRRGIFGKEKVGNMFSGLTKVSWKRKLDYVRYNRGLTLLKSKFPLYAKIEINGQCNLNCVMCRRTELPNRDKQMSKEQFTKVLDNLGEHVALWSPHGYNEPLMHPDFFEFVEIANQRGIRLVLVTNGTLLTEEMVDRLVQYNPLTIRISMDATRGAYEEIRRGSEFRTIQSNIRNLANVTNGSGINVEIYSTIWKDNLLEIPSLVSFANEMGIPITFADINYSNDYRESTEDNALRVDMAYCDIIDYYIEEYSSKTVTFHLRNKLKRTCHLPWSFVAIDVIGDVIPCSDVLEEVMGNIFETSIDKIFNSEKYQNFRLASYQGTKERCRTCLTWGEPG